MTKPSYLDLIEEADRAKWGVQIRFIVAALPFIISFFGGIVLYLTGTNASLRYFELVAQIIPVLVLALVIEQRFFFQELPTDIPGAPNGLMQDAWNRMIWRRIYQSQAFVFLLLAGGEVAALWSAGSTESSPFAFAAATAGLTAGALAVMTSSAKGLLLSLGEKEIAKYSLSRKERVEEVCDQRLDIWKAFIEHANKGVAKSKKATFEEKMKESAMLLLEVDLQLGAENFNEESERLSEKEGQKTLTPGEEMALRQIRQVESWQSETRALEQATKEIARSSIEPKFAKGDKIQLLEDVGLSRAGTKGTVVEQLEDDAIMIATKTSRFPRGHQTAVVKPSEIRLIG
jgi:hypothetical protein